MITEKEAREYFLRRYDEAFSRSGEVAIRHVQGHSARLAAAAKKIAERMQINGARSIAPTEAYVAGLLHDIGKTDERWSGLDHVTIGYDMLVRKGWNIPARVAMTHTWYGYGDIDRGAMWMTMEETDVRRVREFMDAEEMTDLDRLIQLCDNMASYMGIMTISDRFSDILTRHNLADAGAHLRSLYGLKTYFDEKCGINIYELFKSDIIETSMQEPNGEGGDNFNWREDEI